MGTAGVGALLHPLGFRRGLGGSPVRRGGGGGRGGGLRRSHPGGPHGSPGGVGGRVFLDRGADDRGGGVHHGRPGTQPFRDLPGASGPGPGALRPPGSGDLHLLLGGGHGGLRAPGGAAGPHRSAPGGPGEWRLRGPVPAHPSRGGRPGGRPAGGRVVPAGGVVPPGTLREGLRGRHGVRRPDPPDRGPIPGGKPHLPEPGPGGEHPGPHPGGGGAAVPRGIPPGASGSRRPAGVPGGPAPFPQGGDPGREPVAREVSLRHPLPQRLPGAS